MSRLPVSFQSLLIQCAALMLAWLSSLLPGIDPFPELVSQALTVAGIAAVLSLMARQAIWWPLLHFLFPVLIVLAMQIELPAWVYLLAFLLLLLFYWNSVRLRVPLYLSDRKAWQALIPLLPPVAGFRFIDLGSGFGDVPLYLAPRFTRAHFFGTETAPAPWLISRARAWLARSRVTFLRRDYRELDLADYDVVFAFLSPAAMPALWRQAQMQMRAGSLFVSLSFAVDAREPDTVVALANGERHTLYTWRM